jgi:Mn2+/Fe2+ NRAMP family transporter
VAVVLFTAFLFQYVFGLTWSLAAVTTILVGMCAALLAIGRFRALDRAVKLVLILLAISTLIAALVSLPRLEVATFAPWPFTKGTSLALPFLLALAGWMPSAIDISVWSSLWTLAKDRDTGTRASVQHALLDFRIGYIGTAVLAFAFVTLGAAVMFGSGQSFSPQGTGFSVQLVELYGESLGAWTRPIVLVAVVTTMFSTSLTVIDGFPRALARSFRALREEGRAVGGGDVRLYWIWLVVFGVLTVVVISEFSGNLTTMVDFATIVSFLTAPVLGYINLRAVTGPNVAAEHQPGRGLVALSYLGLFLLGGTGVAYGVSLLLG